MKRQASEPTYFITMAEAGPHRGSLIGASGATDLLWQVRDSVSDLVTEPLLLKVNYMTVGEMPDLMMHNEVMIVSQALRETLESWLKDYEFFETHVELSAVDEPTNKGGGEVIKGYWWLNSWRRLDIVDWDRSDMAFYPTPRPTGWSKDSPLKATRWKRLILKRPVPETEHFFGLASVRGEHRYISQALHQHLLAKGLRIRFSAKMFEPCDPSISVAITRTLNEAGGGQDEQF